MKPSASTTPTTPPALAGYQFQPVVIPKFATDTPVAISVRGEGKSAYLIVSLSRRLVEATGMAGGQQWECHCDPKKRAVMLVQADSQNSRKVLSQEGTRCRVAFPHRPFAKLLPSSMTSTPANLIIASEGRVVFELPSAP